MFKKNKLNNNGSTMVMAIIAIAFVAMLAAMILAASFANINMKRMENRSKDTFYTAETVLDEVRVGLGHESVESLRTSYEYVMTHLVEKKDGFSYVINNEVANETLRTMFIEDMLSQISGGLMVFPDTGIIENNSADVMQKACEYLNQNLDGYYETSTGLVRSATVKNVGKITAIRESDVFGNTIVLTDVEIEYKEDKADENYFAKVTVDLNVTFPDIEVDFTGGNRLSNFLEYAMVADQYIYDDASQLYLNSAHMYAGTGIKVTNGALLHVKGDVLSTVGDTSNANIVTRGDIYVQGASSKISSFTVNGGDIWCDNLTVDSNLGLGTVDVTMGAVVDIDEFSKTYVQDDLNLFGKNSMVYIGGEYYGYSAQGASTTSHRNSSAVIISGSRSNLDFNVNKLVVGGRSYIIVSEATNQIYMTGESLSVKANQDLYLIPSKYIYDGHGIITNPMSRATWDLLQTNAATVGEPIVDLTGFFAYSANQNDSLVNNVTPYVAKEYNGTIYLYYNFKDKASSSKFIEKILQGSDAALKDKVTSYFTSLFSGGSSSGVHISDSSAKFTSGVMFETHTGSVINSGSELSGSLSNSMTAASGSLGITTDVFALTSLDCSKRYNILTRLLVDIPEMKGGDRYIVDNEIPALNEFYDGFDSEDKENFAETSYYGKTVSENIINFSLLNSSEYNTDNGYLVEYLTGEPGIIKVATKGNYTVPTDVTGGVIVSGGDVILDHNFKGLIICKGSIRVTNSNITVTTDATMVENLIKNEYLFFDGVAEGGTRHKEEHAFKEYFNAYKSSVLEDPTEEPVQIENISYKDMVGYDNWRKN